MNQEQIVLKHLNEQGTLSGLEAQELYRIVDLPKRISVLRKQGHDIVPTMRRDATGKRYARYYSRRAFAMLMLGWVAV